MVEHQIQYLEGKIKTARMLVGEDGIAMCSAGVTRYAPNENSIRIANTLLLQQKAFASFLEGDFKRFEEMVKEAVTLESQCEYSFGPPDIASPSFEQYGFWLLDQNRPQEALDYFDKSLERAPGRARALLGKVEALSKLNMKTESENVKNKLKEIWKQADSEALTYLAAI